MKSFIKSFVALCAVYFLASGLAVADIGPAEVGIDEGLCGVLNEHGFPHPIPSEDRLVISAHSANGNITFTCTLDLPRPESKRSVIFNLDNTGRQCNINGVPTDDWHQVISASGKAKLVCHLH